MSVPALELDSTANHCLSKSVAVALFKEAEFCRFGHSFSLFQRYQQENSLVLFIRRRLETTKLTWKTGTHDRDSAEILLALMNWREQRSDLQFPPEVRSLSALWYNDLGDEEQAMLARRARTYAHMQEVYGYGSSQNLASEITVRIADFSEENFIFEQMEREVLELTGVYLVQLLSREALVFKTTPKVQALCTKMVSTLQSTGHWTELISLCESKDLNLRDKWLLMEDWLLASSQYKASKSMLSLGVASFLTPRCRWSETTTEQRLWIGDLKEHSDQMVEGKILLDCSQLLT